MSALTDVVPRVWTLDRDPKDEPYLNLALATKSQYLVTRDKDLLDLMVDETFRTQHPALQIIEPPTLLRKLQQASPSEGPAA